MKKKGSQVEKLILDDFFVVLLLLFIFWASHLRLYLGSTLAAFAAQIIFLSDPGTMVKVFKTTRGSESQQQQQQEQRDTIQLECNTFQLEKKINLFLATATRRSNVKNSNQRTGTNFFST